ncbi:MAG: hypothetical protein HQ490_06690 [Lutibacter sp.]|jgi:hypothetical protein|nr:hypothetical protein [Lutibacter sp.]
MKTFQLLLILMIAFTISCQDKKPDSQQKENKATAKVKHYICDNKCENSGGDIAGNCPTCNTPYTHNQAYHNDEFLKNGPLNIPKTNLGTPTNPNTNTAASPAQNALGIFHYTCTSGCYGGAGTASKCTSCGSDLAHNQAYHN